MCVETNGDNMHMRIFSVPAYSMTFYGFSDDIKRAKRTLQTNSAIDGYLKDGKTIIIERLEIKEGSKTKEAGKGAIAGLAGGATGTALVKNRKSMTTSDDKVDDISNDAKIDANEATDTLSDGISNTSDAAETVVDSVPDVDLSDAQDAAEGIFGAVKGILKSIFDLD